MSVGGSDSDFDVSKREIRFAPINGHRQLGAAVRNVSLAEAMLMAEFVCIRRALSVARKRLETGPA